MCRSTRSDSACRANPHPLSAPPPSIPRRNIRPRGAFRRRIRSISGARPARRWGALRSACPAIGTPVRGYRSPSAPAQPARARCSRSVRPDPLPDRIPSWGCTHPRRCFQTDNRPAAFAAPAFSIVSPAACAWPPNFTIRSAAEESARKISTPGMLRQEPVSIPSLSDMAITG